MKKLATKIRAGHERELKELQQFDTSEITAGTAGHDDQHQADMIQASQKSIARVRNATGKDVDRAFLEEMAKHHQMAIDMVQNTKFENARLKQTATKMRASQTQELQELKLTQQRVS